METNLVMSNNHLPLLDAQIFSNIAPHQRLTQLTLSFP